jgi:hypothetical protein
MAGDDLISFEERDERALPPSDTLGQCRRGLKHDVLIPAGAVPISSPISAVDGRHDTGKAEDEDPEKALHEMPLEADLENDAPLSEKSNCSPTSDHRIRSSGLASILKQWPGMKWIDVIILVLGNVAILIAYGIFLYSRLKPSIWRRNTASMISLITVQSTILSFAITVQVTMLLFELCRTKSKSLRSDPQCLTSGNTLSTLSRTLNCRVWVIAVFNFFVTATIIASYFFISVLSDLDLTTVDHPAKPPITGTFAKNRLVDYKAN